VIRITTKEYLRQTFKLDAQINCLIQEVETMEARATKVTTVLNPSKVEKNTGACTNNQEDIVVKMIDYKNNINKKIDELVDLKADILTTISKMDNTDQQTVLMLRYINRKYFEQIAVEMNYSYRNVLYIHGAALKSFEKLCTPLHIEL
jgi:DNA-directed RNA polymerase specialized sigma subunit